MSTCNKCGAKYPTAPQDVIHKCQCTGGMMIPDDLAEPVITGTYRDEPPAFND